mmetsp:Transcript_7258/g.23837  ORF Transcript_7258/g.23837 Transcript_7258/m.23837 type:complete len:297 (+) Transcript_7258:1597-2487(+)
MLRPARRPPPPGRRQPRSLRLRSGQRPGDDHRPRRLGHLGRKRPHLDLDCLFVVVVDERRQDDGDDDREKDDDERRERWDDGIRGEACAAAGPLGDSEPRNCARSTEDDGSRRAHFDHHSRKGATSRRFRVVVSGPVVAASGGGRRRRRQGLRGRAPGAGLHARAECRPRDETASPPRRQDAGPRLSLDVGRRRELVRDARRGSVLRSTSQVAMGLRRRPRPRVGTRGRAGRLEPPRDRDDHRASPERGDLRAARKGRRQRPQARPLRRAPRRLGLPPPLGGQAPISRCRRRLAGG